MHHAIQRKMKLINAWKPKTGDCWKTFKVDIIFSVFTKRWGKHWKKLRGQLVTPLIICAMIKEAEEATCGPEVLPEDVIYLIQQISSGKAPKHSWRIAEACRWSGNWSTDKAVKSNLWKRRNLQRAVEGILVFCPNISMQGGAKNIESIALWSVFWRRSSKSSRTLLYL